ncbi:glycosyltransferase [Pseudoxanthomonas taiwanensis]|uniref:Glycosyl transferase family 28 n=1 Tax=Pseudoxanthomonas taiwanensis TaxID=176598 RepID=A0A921TDE3_9GAMM|nr:glycosyltransferase [Pseudoxanthomonas taiwanensis]KAF1688286.1 glycosyl transferase family 28 [Pseudoxanthomonas taiwanensis]
MSKIFFSAGTQAPFPRLCGHLADWLRHHPRHESFFQVGPNGIVPEGFTGAQLVSVDEFQIHMEEADVIVSHAGMGNIISALELGTPLVIMPRMSALGEHVNDHQIDTASEVSQVPGIFLCETPADFSRCMERALSYSPEKPELSTKRRAELVEAVSDFLLDKI